MREQMQKIKESLINRYFETEEEEESEDYNSFDSTTIDEKEDLTHSLLVEESKLNEEVKPEVQVAVIEKPSTISKTTEITGNLNTQSDLFIYGNVFGDICTTGQIEIVGGIIVGNIKASSVLIKGAKVQGNIECQLTIDSYQNSEIIGNIKSKKATLDCLCQGNIYVNEVLYLSSHANIKGDIQINKIKIDEGAIIDGRIKVKN